jgi:SAM-dependent methyltransferase
MTSRYETEMNLEGESTPHEEQPAPASAEAAYDRLTGYGFARRYVKGKVVADIGREVGYGSRLLAETAESVTGLISSPETVDQASAVYSAPNVSYRTVDLPDLPFPDGTFDVVVVALGVVENLERPEDLVRTAERALKEDGVLVICAVDKQTNTNDRNPGANNGRREMYVPEFRQLLERHFEYVRIYRQGAVAGGFVFPASEEVTGASVESTRFSLTNHDLSVEPPTTRSVIAVCSDATEALGAEEQPYLLLDRDRRAFDEYEERVEDVELLRGEVQRMQETEVQAFVDAIKVRRSLIQELPRYASHILPHMRNMILEHLIHRRNIIRGNIYAIRRKGVKGLALGAFRRSAAFYRQLQAKTRDSD